MGANAVLEGNGRFVNGHIVLDKPPALPEGAPLHVRITVRQPQKLCGFPPGFLKISGSIADLEHPGSGRLGMKKQELAEDENEWPEGFFDLAGSAPDLECPPQLEAEAREPLDNDDDLPS